MEGLSHLWGLRGCALVDISDGSISGGEQVRGLTGCIGRRFVLAAETVKANVVADGVGVAIEREVVVADGALLCLSKEVSKRFKEERF